MSFRCGLKLWMGWFKLARHRKCRYHLLDNLSRNLLSWPQPVSLNNSDSGWTPFWTQIWFLTSWHHNASVAVEATGQDLSQLEDSSELTRISGNTRHVIDMDYKLGSKSNFFLSLFASNKLNEHGSLDSTMYTRI